MASMYIIYIISVVTIMIKKLTKFISPLSLFHPFRLTRGTAYLFAQLQNCRMFTTAIQTSSVSVLEP